MNRIKKRPSLGTILGFTALFIALSATAWASVPRNSVGTAKIKRAAVTAPKIKNGAVKFNKIAPKARERLGGEKGDKGDPGEPGPPGPRGQDGVSGYEVVQVSADWTAGSNSTVANCPEGKVPLGGGYDTQQDNAGNSHLILGSKPQGNGWRVFGKGAAGHAEPTVIVFATCAAVTAEPAPEPPIELPLPPVE